jgi:hypothetical protein
VVKLNDLLGDNVETASSRPEVDPVIVPRPIDSLSLISDTEAAIADVNVAVEATE